MSACNALVYVVLVQSNPTTNGGTQNGSSVGISTHCTHILACLAPICVLSRCLVTKFLRRSSVRSLFRVRCWLGNPLGWEEAKQKNLA